MSQSSPCSAQWSPFPRPRRLLWTRLETPAAAGAAGHAYLADDKSALIYGQWGELYLGYWSAVDVLINPFHPDVASNGGALLHAFLDADVAVRHPQAFAYAEV